MVHLGGVITAAKLVVTIIASFGAGLACSDDLFSGSGSSRRLPYTHSNAEMSSLIRLAMHAIIAFFWLFDYIDGLRVNQDVSSQNPTLSFAKDKMSVAN